MEINGGKKHGRDNATFQVLKPLCSNCLSVKLRISEGFAGDSWTENENTYMPHTRSVFNT